MKKLSNIDDLETWGSHEGAMNKWSHDKILGSLDLFDNKLADNILRNKVPDNLLNIVLSFEDSKNNLCDYFNKLEVSDNLYDCLDTLSVSYWNLIQEISVMGTKQAEIKNL